MPDEGDRDEASGSAYAVLMASSGRQIGHINDL